MSRVGKKPVAIPEGVKVAITEGEITVKGKKGEVRQRIVPGVKVAVCDDGKELSVSRNSDSKKDRALHGLYRVLVQNMITGVTNGYEKKLRIMGTGYRVEAKGNGISVVAGMAKAVEFQPPAGIEIEILKATSREYMDFVIRGTDKQMVGEVASRIRRIRPPDLYLGKGIRYVDEQVRKLEGKSFGAGGK